MYIYCLGFFIWAVLCIFVEYYGQIHDFVHFVSVLWDVLTFFVVLFDLAVQFATVATIDIGKHGNLIGQRFVAIDNHVVFIKRSKLGLF